MARCLLHVAGRLGVVGYPDVPEMLRAAEFRAVAAARSPDDADARIIPCMSRSDKRATFVPGTGA